VTDANREFCEYMKEWKRDNPAPLYLPIPELDKEGETSFWSLVSRHGRRRCWIWLGKLNTGGYGTYRIDGKSYLAHRIAFYLINNELSVSLVLDHLCCNSMCVSPYHLEPITDEENMLRAQRRERWDGDRDYLEELGVNLDLLISSYREDMAIYSRLSGTERGWSAE
jgi:hypothetical protein